MVDRKQLYFELLVRLSKRQKEDERHGLSEGLMEEAEKMDKFADKIKL